MVGTSPTMTTWAPTVGVRALAEDYGEDRFVAVARVEGLLITVVFTERGERVRIISARKANNDERRAYDHS